MDFKMNLSSTYFLAINIILILLSFAMAKLLLKKKNSANKEKEIDLKYYEKGYLSTRVGISSTTQ